MFCIKCGGKIPEDADFCGKCGAKKKAPDGVSEAQTAAAPEPAKQIAPNMELIFGSGVNNPSISTVWGYATVLGALAFGVGLMFAFIFRDTTLGNVFAGDDLITREFGNASTLMLIVGIGLFFLAMYFGHRAATSIKGTWLQVYQNQVKGSAVDGNLSLAKLIFGSFEAEKAKLRSIDFSFKQITSVDVEENSVTLGVSGVKYKVFVENGADIAHIINEKIR